MGFAVDCEDRRRSTPEDRCHSVSVPGRPHSHSMSVCSLSELLLRVFVLTCAVLVKCHALPFTSDTLVRPASSQQSGSLWSTSQSESVFLVADPDGLRSKHKNQGPLEDDQLTDGGVFDVQDSFKDSTKSNNSAAETSPAPPVTAGVGHRRRPWEDLESCKLKRRTMTIAHEGCAKKTIEVGTCWGRCYQRNRIEIADGEYKITNRPRCCRARETKLIHVELDCNGSETPKRVPIRSATLCQCSTKHRD